MLRHAQAVPVESCTHHVAWWSDTAVPYYGIPPAQLADVSTIRVPILGHFGERDTYAGFSDPQVTQLLTRRLPSTDP